MIKRWVALIVIGVLIGGFMIKGRTGWPAGWGAGRASGGFDLSPPTPIGLPELFGADGLVGARVRMYIAGSGWVDITDKVRTATTTLRWRTGRPEGQRRPTAGQLTFSLNNHDGWASPRNPLSPYYGRLGRNTPVRVELAGTVVWSGEIASLPLNWDTTGQDRWVTLTANGIRRRLGQWVKPVRSPLHRVLTVTPDVAEYWPLDEQAGATQATSGLIGHAPLSGASGLYGQVGGFPSNTAGYIETLSGTGYPVAPYTTRLTGMTSGSWAIDHWFKVQVTNPETVGIDVPTLRWTTSGTQYAWSAGVSRSLIDGAYLVNAGSGYSGSESGFGFLVNEVAPDDVNPFDGRWHMIRVTAEQLSTTSFTFSVYLDGQLIGTTTPTNPPSGVFGNEVGKIIRVQAGAYAPNVGTATNVSSIGVGELTVWTSANPSLAADEVYDAGQGYAGEFAGRRCQRLCAEEGIPFAAYGDLDDTHQVGPQTTLPVLTLLDLAADSDMASLVEQTSDLGLAFQTRTGRYNPDGLTISWNDQFISPPFTPTDDDTYVVNDVTTTNQSGTVGRYERTSGPMNTGNPGGGDPDAVGRYDAVARANLLDESLLPLHAGWVGHEGTWDEARWPQLVFDLHREALRADPVVTAALLALRPGSFLRITDPPAGLPPDDIELTVTAVAGSVSNYECTLTLTCVPAGMLRVGRYDVDRYSPDRCVTLADLTTTDTTMTVHTTGPRWAVSGDTGYSVPYDIRIGGERVQVGSVAQSGLDAFGRTVAGGWGSADTGGAWSVSPTAGDYSVGSGVGTISLATLATGYTATLAGAGGSDHDVQVDVRMPTLPATSNLRAGVITRYLDASNYQFAEMIVSSTGAVTLFIGIRESGTNSTLASVTIPTTYTANAWWRIRARSEGETVSLRAYPTAGPVPATWQVTGSTIAVPTGLGLGVFARNDSALTRTVDVDALVVGDPQTFTVTRSVNGVVKEHPAGSRVELFTPARYAF